ncbi:helix-turn-helix transcriptional regulator [Halosimplex sp. J119]
MDNDVRARREQLELSQGDLADAVGVTRQTINAIERDRYDPSLELAMKLAALFDCPVSALFSPERSSWDLPEDPGAE